MKCFFIAASLLVSSSLFSQFKIVGEFKNYSEQPVMVRLFKGSSDKLINKVTTDKNGKFQVNVPEKFSGMIRLTLPSNNAFLDILSDNENVNFKSELGKNGISNIVYSEGKTAQGFQSYQNFEGFNDLKSNIFPMIKQLYQPEDEFYKAVLKEEERIGKISPKMELPLLNYFVQINELANTNVEGKPAAQMHMHKILTRFVNDNHYLEGTGFMSKLVLDYLRYSIVGAQSQEEINQILEKEIDNLLVKTDLETSRGQNILSSIFLVLPAEQFSGLLSKYYSKASSLTCEITDELKTSLSAHNNVAPGKVVPNIVFQSPVKGFKSLHEVKGTKKLVVFWASWCPACNDEMPFIKEYYRNFKKEGGEIITISLDIDENSFKDATKDFEWINYTELLQWDTSGVAEFGVSATPTLFLLDKDNKLIKKASHISDLVDL
jgi:thiol-disulfide isomerase/thioredoxin